jgi:hypothetical protein
MQAIIMARITSMLMPMGRIIMRMHVSAMSAMFEHIAAQVAISAPIAISAPAHIVAAIEQEFIAWMHSCIAPMSIGILPTDIDFIISIVSTSVSRSRVLTAARELAALRNVTAPGGPCGRGFLSRQFHGVAPLKALA